MEPRAEVLDLRTFSAHEPDLLCQLTHCVVKRQAPLWRLGYSVEPAHRGHHYAARAGRLLLLLARSHGMETLWITCNPDNWASRRPVCGDCGRVAQFGCVPAGRAEKVPLPHRPVGQRYHLDRIQGIRRREPLGHWIRVDTLSVLCHNSICPNGQGVYG